MLPAVLYGLFWHSASTLCQQIPFQTTERPENSTAPFIFAGLSGLLQQWPNTVHGTGHLIVPAILDAFTLLYHARQDAESPPSPEWLAWDSAMSTGIMLPRGGETHLLTYRTTRPATLLYFDGMSASWGPDGWLDSQHMFIYGMTKNGSKDIGWWDDYGRADKLCQWAKPHGVEGFVRMNAGFEIIWCDFQSPTLQLVSHLNITPPGTPERAPSPWPPRRNLASLEDPMDPPERPPRRGPGGGRPGGPGEGGPRRGDPWGRQRISDLALTETLEWIRAAAHRSFSPQPHLTLLYSGMVTYYHPRLTSLHADRVGRAMNSHRIINISSGDAMSVVEEVEQVVARIAAGDRGSSMPWGDTAKDIVTYYGDRILHLEAYFLNASDPDTNATAALPAIRTLAYSLLNPYMQPGVTPNASGWDLFFGAPKQTVSSFQDNTTAFERCTFQTTGFFSQLQVQTTPQESLLQASIETVLARLCRDFGVIFAQSFDLVEADSAVDPRPFIQQGTQMIRDLIQWLDWSTWLRCEDVCPRDHVCSTPVWPIAWGRWGQDQSELDLKPRCMRIAV